MIRLARVGEVERLREIERDAGVAFGEIGLDMVAEAEPLPAAELAEYVAAGRAWVHVDDDDRPVAYLVADVVDGAAHIEQVSVDPAHAGAGLGRDLIDHTSAWAAALGFTELTLTTFTDVVWNGPYYERLGFHRMPEDRLGPGLADIRHREAAAGLDRWPRAAMVRSLP